MYLQKSGAGVTLIKCELARRPRILLQDGQHQLTDTIQCRELHHYFRKKENSGKSGCKQLTGVEYFLKT